MPVRPEHSVAILHRVARSSIDRLAKPGPPNSMLRFNVNSLRAWSARMNKITSLAVHPSSSVPTSSNRIDSGTFTKVNPALTRFAYSVAPTPQVSAFEAPPMHVWESVAWMKSPTSMNSSRATWWQMPGETPSFAE